jgi:4-hydroxy-tetrahydrodipicolinate synthase
MVGNFAADVYLDFFKRVANSTTLPVAVQNAPQYLGRALSAKDISILREQCNNLVCVKSEDTALGVQHIVEVTSGQLHILGGRGGLEMTDNLRAGCSGFVLAPDVMPVAVKIFDAWRDGKLEEAETLYAQALPAITFVMQSLEHLITYGKRVYGIHSDTVVHDREPCLKHTDYGLKMTDRWARQLAGVQSKKV